LKRRSLLGHVITIRVITATDFGVTKVGFTIILADLVIITEWIYVTGYRVVLAHSINTVEVVVTFRAVFANLKWSSGGGGGGWTNSLTHVINAVWGCNAPLT